ncbi:MAG: hypothetical protein NVS3B21_26590 [Acidimicrobiales bacterium]
MEMSMPYMHQALLRANEVFATTDGFAPDRLLSDLADADSVRACADRLGLFAILSDEGVRSGLEAYLASLPPSLDAAMVAALRSALGRGLRTQLVWKPGYDFEVRMWEVSEGSDGVLNVMIVSPHPPE